MLNSKVLVVFFLVSWCSFQAKATDKSPNIIVMLMDDVCTVYTVKL